MKKRESSLLAWLNQLKLKQKLWIMQICCVILPLLLTDSVIVGIITYAERQANVQEMNNIADSVEYTIMNYNTQLVSLMQDIYRNREVNEFINGTYISPLDYYSQHLNFAKASLFGLLMNSNSCNVVIYTDAEGIVSGGNFQQMEKAQGEAWYQAFIEQDKDILLYADFAKVNWEERRVISFVRYMNYLDKDSKGAVLRLDWDYSDISRTITNAKYSSTVYVCAGDTILFPTRGGAESTFPMRSCRHLSPPTPDFTRSYAYWTVAGISMLCPGLTTYMRQCERTCLYFVYCLF